MTAKKKKKSQPAKGGSPEKGKLWGGRFEAPTDPAVEAFGASVHFDARLAPWDIRGSIAHAKMLGKQKIIPAADSKKIIQGLGAIDREIARGKFVFDPALEDVHTNIESALTRKIGPAGGKLHTARSRNDQVATATRLFLRDQMDEIAAALKALIETLASLAEKETQTLMPGYTHLQRGQPVTLAHHLLAYAQMFLRDRERLLEARKRTNVLPLGSGALAGSSLPLDREFVAKELEFDGVTQNSLDAVSDRDYQIEFLAAAALSGVHLSRLSEELILWSTAEFAFARMNDAFTTGSSLMPQKRNPDVAELIRGKSGRLAGALVSLMTTMKGLPLSYNRDMQEDKEQLFDAVDTWLDCLLLAEKMLKATHFNRERMAEAAADPNLLATELADYLVRKGMPFREAHSVIGTLVSKAEREERTLVDFTAAELKNACRLFGADTRDVLDAGQAVQSRDLTGGPAPQQVIRQIAALRQALAGQKVGSKVTSRTVVKAKSRKSGK